YIMASVWFSGFSLETQRLVGEQANYWAMLRAVFGNIAFRRRLLSLESLLSATPSARLIGANSHGVTIASTLERIVSAASLAGITVNAFWNTEEQGLVSLGRLVGLDAVISTALDFDPIGETSFLLDNMPAGVPAAAVLLAAVQRLRTPRFAEKLAA